VRLSPTQATCRCRLEGISQFLSVNDRGIYGECAAAGCGLCEPTFHCPPHVMIGRWLAAREDRSIAERRRAEEIRARADRRHARHRGHRRRISATDPCLAVSSPHAGCAPSTALIDELLDERAAKAAMPSIGAI
jgi:hypothetical protein